MARPVLVVATSNAAKLREFAQLLRAVDIDLHDLAGYASIPQIEEPYDSYLANAALKAITIARHTNLPALADDSGLEVAALGGQPGARSARFAGETASDAENIARLLEQLKGVDAAQRNARFRCVLVVARADAGLFAEGTCEGTISSTPSGDSGFGYDPVFYYPPLARTFAQLDADTKNQISHRARACARLAPLLLDFLRR